MTMAKNFDHTAVESQIYDEWEKSGAFQPRESVNPSNRKSVNKPFTIVLPPPNASGKMHMGNVLMIAIEDLMIRHHRMKGDPTLWIPGTDHAGFETQITYERELKKQGKSRFEFDRSTLYQNIWEFVQNNKSQIEGQIKQMGASVDWSRYTFTLDPHVIETVYTTFAKMYKEGLVYRDNYMVNYCPKCGTTFADLEILHEERVGKLYYIRYAVNPLSRKSVKTEYIQVATTRPETIMLDTHIAVNPKDKKRASWIGKKVINPLTNTEMEIIGDEFVDPKFGTGFVKLTPAHDKNDYEAGKKHGLPFIVGIGMDGRMTSAAGRWAGKTVFTAREEVVKELTETGAIEKVDDKYNQSVTVCYKGGHDIEPMMLPNWFVKVESLKKPALEAVTSGKVKIYPKWREITYTKWMEEMHDWPISRQVVWGIRIPVWYEVGKSENQKIQITFLNKEKNVVSGTIGELLATYSFEEIRDGLQTLIAPAGCEMVVSATSPGEGCLQETDTFDTWFSSGHWPLVTLKYPDSDDFAKFYPTSVLETGWEIIRFWVSRMIMFGIYLTGKPPFEYVYLHGLVRSLDGRKMSKSLGNVINPDEYMEKYGVDALRMGLISGTANGKDFAFPKDKIIAYRNFANKLWNMARFYHMMVDPTSSREGGTSLGAREIKWYEPGMEGLTTSDTEIMSKLNDTIKMTDELLEKFRFAEAAETIYHFMWDEVAAKYLEEVKNREDQDIALTVLRHVLLTGLKLLHPFMPFVTEAIWKEMPRKYNDMLIVSKWPSYTQAPTSK
ncbi:valine--tRNA ligase [Candidatus Woesebacteria bacterium]|nr:valine--tRNA ligase [Candidatus Woesebacteria bacterium]